MRIDSSGNLLVGTTNSSLSNSSSPSITGINLKPNSASAIARDGGTVLYLNRISSDGDILQFRKSGTSVGSIESATNTNTDISIGSDNIRLLFFTGGNAIVPRAANNVSADTTIDLGNSGNRFKDLYLSGTANVGYVNGSSSVSIPDNYSYGFGGTGSNTYISGSNAANSIWFRTNGNERARIDSSGNLLVGTTTLADVNNIITNHLFEGASSTAGKAAVGVYNNTGTANCPAFNVLNRDTSTDTTNRFVQFYANVTSTGATAMGGIVGNGANNVQFATLSDVREKQNIKAITNSLDKITSLNPVEFDWIASGEHCKAGFVAQEVEEVFPEFVVENIASEGQEERKGLTGGMTSGIVAHLVKAIQEQQTLIESLTTRIAALEE